MKPNETITLTLTPSADGAEWKLGVAQPDNGSGEPRKYELISDHDGLFRARALQNVYSPHGHIVVRKGALSGQLWGERALSQFGSCWVYGDAKVLDRARVTDNAQIHDYVVVQGDSTVHGNATVTGSVSLSGYSSIHGNAAVSGNVKLTRGASVGGVASVQNNVTLHGSVHVLGGTFYEGVNIEAGDQIVITNGCFVGSMTITGCRDYLQVNTYWGTLTVARLQNGQWLGTIGCQRFGSFARLQALAEDIATDYERDQLEHWFAMMTRLFLHWGLGADVIERTTKLDRDSVFSGRTDDDDM